MMNPLNEIKCKNCGSTDFREENGYRICAFCGSKFLMAADNKPAKDTVLDLQSDVEMLLQKCKENPERAPKIAERILEIDPYNQEAKQILNISNQTNKVGGC